MSGGLAIREETEILPYGDTKEVYKVYPANFGLDAFGILAGVLGGTGASFAITSLSGVSSADFFGMFSMFLLTLGPLSGGLSIAAITQLEKYLTLGLAVSDVKPGYRLKNKRSFRELFTLYRDKRLVMEIESFCGMPPQELVVINKGRRLWIESIDKKAPEDVWDDAIETVKNVYGITPKESTMNQSPPKGMPKRKRSKLFSKNLTDA